MKIHSPTGDVRLGDVPTRCGKLVDAEHVLGETTCAVCLKALAKAGRRSVTATYPGVEEIRAATGLFREVIRSLANVPGCPVVKGGRGYRFASVEAFNGFVAGLTLEQKLRVPVYAAALKEEVMAQIAKLAWGMDDTSWRQLKRKSYAELLRVRAWWERVDSADKATGGKPLAVTVTA